MAEKGIQWIDYPRENRMSRQLAWLLFALTWLTPATGGEIICATTADELRQALADVAADGTFDEIRLQEGTYYTGGQVFSYSAPARSLRISGGWYNDHDPCDFQHPRADTTILDGQNVTAILNISDPGDAAGTVLSVSNLTLRNGSTSTNGESAALALYGALGQELRVQNVFVLGSHNTKPPPLSVFTNIVTLIGYADIYFINNVFADCTATYANLGIFAHFQAETVYMHNNTLSLGGGGFNALLDSGGGTAFRIVNNAILGELRFNSHPAVVDDFIRVWMYSNIGQWDITDPFNPILVQADIGNSYSINPGFLGPLNFRPAAGSPLANGGLNSPIGGSSSTDLDGNPRVDLGFIDVGAFESTRERIFFNGFD
jgi:hypothetical protein